MWCRWSALTILKFSHINTRTIGIMIYHYSPFCIYTWLYSIGTIKFIAMKCMPKLHFEALTFRLRQRKHAWCLTFNFANYFEIHDNQIMMTSSNGNILPVAGLLCGEFTGQRSQRPGDLQSICWTSTLDSTDMKSLIKLYGGTTHDDILLNVCHLAMSICAVPCAFVFLCQAIIWINVSLLLFIEPLGTSRSNKQINWFNSLRPSDAYMRR